MNWSALLVALVPALVVTVTLTVPVPAGAVAAHEPAVHDTPVAGVDPKLTVPPARLAPEMVTGVPPAAGPVVGASELTDG